MLTEEQKEFFKYSDRADRSLATKEKYYSKSSMSFDKFDYVKEFGLIMDIDEPFSMDGGKQLISGSYMLYQSIRDIIFTPLGTRFMMPDYGCRIHELLGAVQTPLNLFLAKVYIYEALDKWEKRIKLEDIDFGYIPKTNILAIQINFHNNITDGKDKFTFYYDNMLGIV